MGRGAAVQGVEVRRGQWWLRESSTPRTELSSLLMRCRGALKLCTFSSCRAGHKPALRSTARERGGRGSLGRQGGAAHTPELSLVSRTEANLPPPAARGDAGCQDWCLGGCVGTKWRRTRTAGTGPPQCCKNGASGQDWMCASVCLTSTPSLLFCCTKPPGRVLSPPARQPAPRVRPWHRTPSFSFTSLVPFLLSATRCQILSQTAEQPKPLRSTREKPRRGIREVREARAWCQALGTAGAAWQALTAGLR